MKIRVDVLNKRAWVGQKPIPGLTYTELRVLTHLVTAGGVGLTRKRLLTLAWGFAPDIAFQLAQSSRMVDMAVYRLRTKIKKVSGPAADRLFPVSKSRYRI